MVALKTLSDDETIAKLATGPKRLTLPPEHNHLLLYRSVGNTAGPEAGEALAKLAGLYEDRRQYPAAVDVWDRAAARRPEEAAERIEAITGAYARFETETAGPAGTPATVALTYRNAERAEFRAYRVDERAWLAAVRDEILAADGTENRPSDLRGDPLSDWNPATEKKWVVGDPVVWSVDLDPPADHTPARVQVETPLTDAGLYYVTATLPNGRVYGVGVRRSDLAVVMKPASRNRSLLFVTDAATGDPVAGASLDLLGYGRDYDRAAKGWKYEIARRSATTDADGLAEVPGPDSGRNDQWLVTATKNDRLGWLQTYGGAFGANGDEDPLGRPELKAVAVSDRPLYRPGDAVNLKGWIRTVGYGIPADADEPARRVVVRVEDGRGEEVFSGQSAANAAGAFAASFELPDDATLGRYRVEFRVPGRRTESFNPLTFRVEEYRKPEFEVTVDAPADDRSCWARVSPRRSGRSTCSAGRSAAGSSPTRSPAPPKTRPGLRTTRGAGCTGRGTGVSLRGSRTATGTAGTSAVAGASGCSPSRPSSAVAGSAAEVGGGTGTRRRSSPRARPN